MIGFESASIAAAVIATFLLAGFVKGVIGMGLPTVAMGLLGVVMTPAQAASLLVVPSLVTNVWQLLAGPDFRALIRRLWPMMIGICVGTWASSGILTGGNAKLAALALGVVLFVYGCMGFAALKFQVPPQREPWLSPVIGAMSGAVTGATGVFVIPALPYLQALGLEKEELIQALGLSFTVSTAALSLGLIAGGALRPSIAGSSLMALAPTVAGMLFGQWLRLRTSEQTFRRVFFAGLLVLGAYIALRSAG
jgi:uncharacterized membrane protein YfcA